MNGIEKQTPDRSWTSMRAASNRHAFTLVELLVVIVVIAILIALLVPTIGGAMYSARNAQIGIEISNISQALEAYRTKNGAYPPDFASTDPAFVKKQIDSHLARNYRYRVIIGAQADHLTAEQYSMLDPSEALYFWLRGLSKDKTKPLTGLGDRVGYDFKQSQLQDNDGDGFPEYYVRNSEAPLVYVHPKSYANVFPILVGPLSDGGQHRMRAYATESGYAEPEKYQVICAGQDGVFGVDNPQLAAVYPVALNYSEADDDNITSFSEGKTLKDATP